MISKIHTLLLSLILISASACNPFGDEGSADPEFGENNDPDPSITVDQTDDDNSFTGFGGGTHTGTTYLSGVLTLGHAGGCDATSTNCAELDKSWTPHWDNLIGYWKMDEASWNGTVGEVVDSSGNGNHGVTNGDPATTSDAKIGSHAGTFDGVSDYINLGIQDFSSLAALTYSVWFKTTDDGSPNPRLMELGTAANRIGLYKPNDNTIRIYFRKASGLCDGVNSISTLNDGQWHHAVSTVSSSGIELYIDGVLNSSVATDCTPLSLPSVSTFYIGQYIGGGNYEWIGEIDDAAMWNTALTANEVALIYSRQSAKYSGHMKSRIIDTQNENSSWTNLNWITTLPFGKELSDGGGAANSERSADYSDLSSDNLMDGIVGLWHLNGPEGIIADDTVILDASGNGNHGEAKDPDGINTIAHSKGIFAQGIRFDGDNDYIDLGTVNIGNPLVLNGSEATFTAWFNQEPGGDTYQRIFDKSDSTNGNNGYAVFVHPNSRLVGVGVDGNDFRTMNNVYNFNKWTHIAITITATSYAIYIDGKKIIRQAFR